MKNLYKILLGSFLIGTFASCEYDRQDFSSVVKPVVTAETNNVTVTEGESAVFTLNVDTPNRFELDYKLELVGGTGSFDDFTAPGRELTVDDGLGSLPATLISVPANAASYDIVIPITDDIWAEGTETLIFRLTNSGNGVGLVADNSRRLTVNVTNNETTDFAWVLDWDQIYVGTDGEEHHACDFDLDLELYDAGFGLLATSYSSCPESIRFSAGDLPDGDYWLIPSFWTVASGVPPASDFQIPAMMTVAKAGVWDETIDLTEVWDTATGGNQEGNPDAYLVKYILTITGDTYTVTDNDTGAVIGMGRSAQTLTKPTNFVGGR